MSTIKKIAASSLAIWRLGAGQVCSTSSCTSACTSYDGVFSSCNWDITPYDSKVSCQCQRFGDLKGNVQILNGCVVCDENGLAQHNLADYQIWTVICDTFLAHGEAAAQSVGASPSSAVIQVFSSVFLPALQSTVCSDTSPSASLATSTVSTTPVSTTTSTSTSSPTQSTTASHSPGPVSTGGSSLAISADSSRATTWTWLLALFISALRQLF